MNYQALPYLVIGLGNTGLSVVRYLCNLGYDVVVADSRQRPPKLKACQSQFPQVEIITGKIPHERFDQFKEVVTSPGIALKTDIQVIGDIELFVRQTKSSIVAITGSNGKSTVTMLVSEMLAAAGRSVTTAGNIGTPALDILRQPPSDVVVLELSSFQLESTYSLQADSAAILNISPDHMDRYTNLKEYLGAKARILDAAKAKIIALDDHLLCKLSPGCNWLGFSLSEPATEFCFGVTTEGVTRWLVQGSKKLCLADDLSLLGQHNVANVLAAMALVHGLGIELNDTVIGAACAYQGLPHRCEKVGSWQMVTWINDSKGTNVGATQAALEGLDGPFILIAGGRGKNADFSPLKTVVASKVNQIIVFGEDATQLQQSLYTAAPVVQVDSLEAAVRHAKQGAQSGETILFSPACSSFDMFDNYAVRGECFKRLVLAINQ